MNIKSHSHCVLRSKEGRFLMLRKFRDGLMLCAVARQDAQNAPQVDMWINNKNQLAFSFEGSDGLYFLKVVGKDLTIDTPIHLSESYWFEKCNVRSGEHYGLRSVGEPRQYLYIKTGRQRKVVSIRSTSQGCLQITDIWATRTSSSLF